MEGNGRIPTCWSNRKADSPQNPKGCQCARLALGRWCQQFAVQVRKYLELPHPCTPSFSSEALPSWLALKLEVDLGAAPNSTLPRWTIHKPGLTMPQGRFPSNMHKKILSPFPFPTSGNKVETIRTKGCPSYYYSAILPEYPPSTGGTDLPLTVTSGLDIFAVKSCTRAMHG